MLMEPVLGALEFQGVAPPMQMTEFVILLGQNGCCKYDDEGLTSDRHTWSFGLAVF